MVRTVDAYHVAVSCLVRAGPLSMYGAGVLSLRHCVMHSKCLYVSGSGASSVNPISVACEGDVSLEKEPVFIIQCEHREPTKCC